MAGDIDPRIAGRVNPRKIQPGGILHSRIPHAVTVPDVEQEPNTYILTALVHLAEQLTGLARISADYRYPVDEYVTGSPNSNLAAGTPLEIQPQYENMAERIEAIIVTGPQGVYQLQLGDRYWTPTMPAAGIQVFSPVGLLLNRSDRRILTPNVAGDWSLELMGHADERY